MFTMNPENIQSCFLIGNESSQINTFDYLLFKVAIHFAETGLNVWFISPTIIDKVPEKINPPSREILQLITFLYLKDYKELIEHLNGIELWKKKPDMIILKGFDIYSNINSDVYNALIPAAISTALLSNISYCVSSKQNSASLLVACQPVDELLKSRLQVLLDMYFPFYINYTDQSFRDIVTHFQ